MLGLLGRATSAIPSVVSAVKSAASAVKNAIASIPAKLKAALSEIQEKNERILDKIKAEWDKLNGTIRGQTVMGAILESILFPTKKGFMALDFLLEARKAILEEYPYLDPYREFVGKPLGELKDSIKKGISDGCTVAGKWTYEKKIWGVSDFVGELTGVREKGAESNFFSKYGAFERGILEGAGGMVEGVVDLAANPVGAVEGITKIGAYPDKIIPEVSKKAWEYTDKNLINGTPEERAAFISRAGFEIGSFFIGAGEVKAASTGAKLAEGVKIVDGANDLSRVGKLGEAAKIAEGVEDAGKLAKLSEGAEDAGKLAKLSEGAKEGWFEKIKDNLPKEKSGGGGVNKKPPVQEEELTKAADEAKAATEAVDDIPSAFKQKEFASSYESRINATPSIANEKVAFEGTRGESLCTLKPPPDPDVQKILDEAGIEGIPYRNGVPDFSPTAKAEVEIEHMLGGTGANGSKARASNFAQADRKLAEQLNNSPELARQFGMEPGSISARDIEKFRDKNKLTWHELNDVKTMQLVPTKINSTFGHLGGVGEINAGAFKPRSFAN